MTPNRTFSDLECEDILKLDDACKYMQKYNFGHGVTLTPWMNIIKGYAREIRESNRVD